MAVREPIERRPAMYMQVAERMADDITLGRYKPGELLPSEAQMVERYRVGKATARSRRRAAEHGTGRVPARQGTVVLASSQGMPATSVDRSIHRTAKGSWSLPGTTEAEPPAVSRTALDGRPALLLGQQDQDAISVDRMLYDPATGTRMAHRVLIPIARRGGRHLIPDRSPLLPACRSDDAAGKGQIGGAP